MKKSGRKRRPARPAWVKLAILAAVVMGLFLAWRFTPLADLITVDRIMALARTVGGSTWSPVVLAAVYVPANFVMFPRPLLTLFAVIAFGPWIGFATSISGIIASALAAYYAGRKLPEKTLRSFAGGKIDHTRTALRKHGLSAAIAVSIVPIAPFPVVGMVAGAARIRLWQFVLGTTIGMLPGTVATTLFADQLAAALDDTSKINYWIVAGVVLVFGVLIYFVRAWIRRRMPPSPSAA